MWISTLYELTTFIWYEASTYPQVKKYINDNKAFLKDFQYAFDKMVSVGYGKKGKIGPTLKPICGNHDEEDK